MYCRKKRELQTSTDVSPPPNVEGVVLRVDPTGKCSRLASAPMTAFARPKSPGLADQARGPKYLGQIQIVQTTANTAVAKPVSVTGLIQENDQVGPRNQWQRELIRPMVESSRI
ncbi:MAG: hypothetical protein U1D30_21530 [Planctomycetota bacterium]